MRNTAPVHKNQDLILHIDALTSEGQGVGRVEGFAVFVPFALAGETVSAHVIKVTSSYAVAKLIEVMEPSPERVEPLCPVFYACGGCTVQHLNYRSQLEYKRQAVADALERIGGFKGIEVLPAIGMDEPWQYRNKGSFPIGNVGGEISIGFFSPRSHRLVPTYTCPISDRRVIDTANKVAEWANENRISAYDEQTKRGVLRHVVVRATQAGGIMAVVVTTTSKLPHSEQLKEKLDAVDSLYHNVNPNDTNVIFGAEFKLIFGASVLTETVCGNKIIVSPRSFLQVNPLQCEKLYEKAIEYLNPQPHETIADLYCGVGTISLLLARRAKRVIGIESVPDAIADARRNAELNGLANVDFICGEAEKVLPKRIADGLRPNAIILDPPRKGCEEQVLKAIADSKADRIVYISCNPATLARDLKLLKTHNLTPHLTHPLDMFPHTSHVETIVLLSKLNAKQHIAVDINMDELDLTAPEKKATYEQIKAYVQEHSGLKVSNLNIAQVKQKCGITERKNYNTPKSPTAKQPHCPPEKESAIMAALKHFGMIKSLRRD
ncbi:MAG: 23S rRNA (uracil(1939)-C(5))-methyltransferase RlmD [Clostridia bacterium]|nr:23S rRNA (uracil(1939)-C(5))-methyltransferase RlmD [Clostridia bacterium]